VVAMEGTTQLWPAPSPSPSPPSAAGFAWWWELIGVLVGVLALLLLACILAFLVLRRRRKARMAIEEIQRENPSWPQTYQNPTPNPFAAQTVPILEQLPGQHLWQSLDPVPETKDLARDTKAFDMEPPLHLPWGHHPAEDYPPWVLQYLRTNAAGSGAVAKAEPPFTDPGDEARRPVYRSPAQMLEAGQGPGDERRAEDRPPWFEDYLRYHAAADYEETEEGASVPDGEEAWGPFPLHETREEGEGEEWPTGVRYGSPASSPASPMAHRPLDDYPHWVAEYYERSAGLAHAPADDLTASDRWEPLPLTAVEID